jgi:hypothetical protein
MNVPTHAAEVLLQTCHVHAYAMPALLRFWRACRATMPQRARFDDERLDHLRAQAQKPAPLVWDTRRRTFDRAPVPDYQAAIDARLPRLRPAAIRTPCPPARRRSAATGSC